ncbi:MULTISPECIES: hypothetical protein [unclassified Massilia]|uniref:hypothetical protein n=1 Tax=Massilia sp. Dwa41.01b TaxID=2709302 RepID=UPI001E293CFA|nr:MULTISPECIES: hypothetical protein [unclassified Massilia]
MAQRELHFQFLREGRIQFGEDRAHTAPVVRRLDFEQLAGRHRAVAVAGDVVRLQQA